MIDEAEQRQGSLTAAPVELGPAGEGTAPAAPTVPAAPDATPTRPAARWQSTLWQTAPWWAAPAALWFCFLLLVWQVLSHGPVTRLDVAARNGIQHWAAMPSLGWALPVGRGLADLGDQPFSTVVLVVAVLASVLLTRSWRPLVPTAAIGLGLLAVIPLKIWIGRPGPGRTVLGDAALGFFPSGHTADALLCYGGAALALCRTLQPRAWMRRSLIGLAAGLVALTIAGLLWSDYHWLSDTIGSVCWCGGVLCLAGRLPQRLVRPPGLITPEL
jgi:undecaprenyl-diphosphatase